MDDIVFELPVSELAKVCFQIEFAANKLYSINNHKSPLNYEVAINGIIQLINISNRLDLRGKFLQTFSNIKFYYEKISSHSTICKETLDKSINDIQAHIDILNRSPIHFAESFKQNPFFSNLIKHQQNTMDDKFMTHAYKLWSKQPESTCLSYIDTWSAQFNRLISVSNFYLSTLRNSANLSKSGTKDGYYRQVLDTKSSFIRICLKRDLLVFPSCSVGHHGISVQFYKVNDFNQSATKFGKPVEFLIGYSCLK